MESISCACSLGPKTTSPSNLSRILFSCTIILFFRLCDSEVPKGKWEQALTVPAAPFYDYSLYKWGKCTWRSTDCNSLIIQKKSMKTCWSGPFIHCALEKDSSVCEFIMWLLWSMKRYPHFSVRFLLLVDSNICGLVVYVVPIKIYAICCYLICCYLID